MAIILTEGFDYLASGDSSMANFSILTGSASQVYTVDDTRYGRGKSLCINAYSSAVKLSFPLENTIPFPGSGIVGFALKILDNHPNQLNFVVYIYPTCDASDVNSTSWGVWGLTPYFHSSVNGKDSSNKSLRTNIWYHLEYHFGFHANPSTPPNQWSASLNNEVIILPPAYRSTQQGAVPGTSLRIHSIYGNVLIDDLYVQDCTGPYNKNYNWNGDRIIIYTAPSGNATNSQWVGSDADSTDNYLLVDDTTPDASGTYVYTSTSGNRDSYLFADLPVGTQNVYSVTSVANANKDGAASPNSLTHIMVQQGTVYPSGTTGLNLNSFAYTKKIWNYQPSGNNIWTENAVNNLEAGPELA